MRATLILLLAGSVVACEDAPPPRSATAPTSDSERVDASIPEHGDLYGVVLPEHPVPLDANGNAIVRPPPNSVMLPSALDTANDASTPRGLSPQQIRSVVMTHAGSVRACYDERLRTNKDLQGEMVVAWTIAPDGTTTAASVASSTFSGDVLEACVLRQVRSWKYPASAAITTVSAYPFRFGVAR